MEPFSRRQFFRWVLTGSLDKPISDARSETDLELSSRVKILGGLAAGVLVSAVIRSTPRFVTGNGIRYISAAAALSGSGMLPGTALAKDALTLSLRGQNALELGRLDEAVEVLRRAIAADPQSDFAHGLLGRALHAKGRHGDAVNHFRLAAQLNPEDTYSRMMVDMLTQTPLRQHTPQQLPKSPLERRAKEEEERMNEWLQAHRSEDGRRLGYRIRRIVLDAGHGGFDSGAVGAGGLQEKDVTLELCRRTASILSKHDSGLRVFLTRNDDYFMPLSARTAVANQYSADLFVSFHINASTRRAAEGVETYFCAETASSKEAGRVAAFENSVLRFDEPSMSRNRALDIEDLLFRFERRRYWQAGGAAANALQQRLASALPLRDRGVHSANFYVLRKARMPSILLETGFISNPREERMLRSDNMRQTVAETIAEGIIALAQSGVRV